MRLANKVAIVTGGGSGIGESICLAFAREGAMVVVADRDLAGAERVAAAIRQLDAEGFAIRVDVTERESVRDMVDTAFQRYRRIDVLVNNAGSRFIKGFLEHTEDDWNQMIRVNLTGPFLCSQAVLPHMLKGGKGKVINLASIASFMGRPDRVAYCAAKSGVLGLTRSMAIDMAGKNICVNAIAPGMIATPFNAAFSESPELGPIWAKENLVGRWGEPKDVANAAVFLASDESDFITGTDLKVDGGWLSARARGNELSN